MQVRREVTELESKKGGGGRLRCGWKEKEKRALARGRASRRGSMLMCGSAAQAAAAHLAASPANIVVLLCPSTHESALAKINKNNPISGNCSPSLSGPSSYLESFIALCLVSIIMRPQTSFPLSWPIPKLLVGILSLDKGKKKQLLRFALLHFCPCIQFVEASAFYLSLRLVLYMYCFDLA